MADETTDPILPPNAEGKLLQTVEVQDVGPCKKHIKVTVDRQAIDERLNEKYTEIVRSDSSQVAGFRPGKAPRKIIERRYKDSVLEQVRTEVLMASLEQMATEQQISPLAPPDLDPAKIEIPDEGPFIYEFDVEVRPEFELPEYKGMKLKRQVRTFSPEDVENELLRLLAPISQLIPVEGDDASVKLNDQITCDVVISQDDKTLNELKDIRVKVEKQLVLRDGVATKFGKSLEGAKPSETRKVSINLSNPSAQGGVVEAAFTIKDIKRVRKPEINEQILNIFNVANEEQLNEMVESLLNRRHEYSQKQYFRRQIVDNFVEASTWQLPQDLLIRQAKRTLQRRLMEMKNSGMGDEEIQAAAMRLQQDALQSTARSLKEHFILQKISEVEKIEIVDQDIDEEIERLAEESDESPRKVRARLEKEDMMETLATELLERRALDIILNNAVYEDVELKEEDEEGTATSVAANLVPESTPASSEAGTPAE